MQYKLMENKGKTCMDVIINEHYIYMYVYSYVYMCVCVRVYLKNTLSQNKPFLICINGREE